MDNELEVQSAGERASMIDRDGELCRVELLLLADDCYLSAWNFAEQRTTHHRAAN